MESVIVVKDGLLREISPHSELLPQHRNQQDSRVLQAPTRIRGGNWQAQPIHRYVDDYDETECQAAIGEFIAEMQERLDSVE